MISIVNIDLTVLRLTSSIPTSTLQLLVDTTEFRQLLLKLNEVRKLNLFNHIVHKSLGSNNTWSDNWKNSQVSKEKLMRLHKEFYFRALRKVKLHNRSRNSANQRYPQIVLYRSLSQWHRMTFVFWLLHTKDLCNGHTDKLSLLKLDFTFSRTISFSTIWILLSPHYPSSPSLSSLYSLTGNIC